jgi:hypothetical protein
MPRNCIKPITTAHVSKILPVSHPNIHTADLVVTYKKVEIAIRLLSDMVIGKHFQTSSSDESRVLLANLMKKPLQSPFREIYLGLSAIFWVLNYQHEIIDLWQYKVHKFTWYFVIHLIGLTCVHQFIECLLTAKTSYAYDMTGLWNRRYFGISKQVCLLLDSPWLKIIFKIHRAISVGD